MGRGAYPGPVSEVDPAVARAVACVSRPRGTCRHESGAALSGLTHGGDCRSARPGRWRQAGRLRQIVDAGSVKIREAGLRYRSQGREEAWSRVRRDGATGVNFLRGRQPDAENQEVGTRAQRHGRFITAPWTAGNQRHRRIRRTAVKICTAVAHEPRWMKHARGCQVSAPARRLAGQLSWGRRSPAVRI